MTLVLLPDEGGCEEQVYLHLQAELQLREARAEVATLRLQVRQLEAEAVRREAAAETARREHGARVARLDAAKQEDIQTSVGLRLANSNIFHILHKIFFPVNAWHRSWSSLQADYWLSLGLESVFQVP